jgi:hypothetical protein
VSAFKPKAIAVWVGTIFPRGYSPNSFCKHGMHGEIATWQTLMALRVTFRIIDYSKMIASKLHAGSDDFCSTGF